MSTFRLLSLGTLLASVFIGTGNAQSADGDRTWTVFAPVPPPPVLFAPSAIAVGPDHTVYVTDAANGRVQILSAAGKVLAQWDSHLTYPTGIAVGRDGSMYVTEMSHSTLSVTKPPAMRRSARSTVITSSFQSHGVRS